MSFGLSSEALRLIAETLGRHRGVTRAVIFGSRAKGTETPSSDIDLSLWGVSQLEAEAIQLDLEELPLPYVFNVVAYGAITHPPLREHIDRVGRLVFEADQNSR